MFSEEIVRHQSNQIFSIWAIIGDLFQSCYREIAWYCTLSTLCGFYLPVGKHCLARTALSFKNQPCAGWTFFLKEQNHRVDILGPLQYHCLSYPSLYVVKGDQNGPNVPCSWQHVHSSLSCLCVFQTTVILHTVYVCRCSFGDIWHVLCWSAVKPTKNKQNSIFVVPLTMLASPDTGIGFNRTCICICLTYN